MKSSRFYLRLSDEERERFDEVTRALGLGSTSDAIRFVMLQKHRELLGDQPSPTKKKRSKKKR
jgi:hypothetical protein